MVNRWALNGDQLKFILKSYVLFLKQESAESIFNFDWCEFALVYIPANLTYDAKEPPN